MDASAILMRSVEFMLRLLQRQALAIVLQSAVDFSRTKALNGTAIAATDAAIGSSTLTAVAQLDAAVPALMLCGSLVCFLAFPLLLVLSSVTFPRKSYVGADVALSALDGSVGVFLLVWASLQLHALGAALPRFDIIALALLLFVGIGLLLRSTWGVVRKLGPRWPPANDGVALLQPRDADTA